MRHGERVTLLERGIDKLGRIYSKEDLDKPIIYGTVGLNEDVTISAEKISHTFTDIDVAEDGTVTGKLNILETQNGKLLTNLLEENCHLNTIIYGVGSYDDFTRKVSSYRLIRIDIN